MVNTVIYVSSKQWNNIKIQKLAVYFSLIVFFKKTIISLTCCKSPWIGLILAKCLAILWTNQTYSNQDKDQKIQTKPKKSQNLPHMIIWHPARKWIWSAVTKTRVLFLVFLFCTITEQTSHGLRNLAGLKKLKMPIYAHIFRRAILTRNVGETNLVLVCNQGSLVGLCKQDYKSLCTAVMICSPLVNTQTHIHTRTAFWPACMKSSTS